MATYLLTTLIVLCTNGEEKTTRQVTVDRIDINHVYDDEGKISLDQLILYRYKYHLYIFEEIDDYAIIKPERKNKAKFNERTLEVYNPPYEPHSQFIPMKQGEYWIFFLRIYDQKIELRTKILTESHTQYDPEFNNNDIYYLRDFRIKSLHATKPIK